MNISNTSKKHYSLLTENTQQSPSSFIDIQQGKSYLERKKMLKSGKYGKKKDLSSSPSPSKLTSNTPPLLKEAFENTTTPNIDQVAKKELEEMKQLENTFQETLSKYASTYKLYMQDVVKFVDATQSKYHGKNIRDKNGAIYYVTNGGVARWYNSPNWESRHDTCKQIPLEQVDTLENINIQRGEPMPKGQPCGYELQNVKIAMDESKIINLARLDGVVASQNTSYQNGRFPAPNAIDGDRKTFNHTLNRKGTWWQVKLRKNSYIERVVIYNREDCCQDRFTTVQLDVLDENGSSIYRTVIRRTSNNQMVFSVENIHRNGRFVRLTQEVADFLHMGEVEVYGTELENIQNGNIGYVNENGQLRAYPKNDMRNTSGTCPTHITDIDGDTWRAFERGAEMSPDTLCALGNVDPSLRQQVIQLNNELIGLSNQIYAKIEDTQKKLANTKTKNVEEERMLQQQIQVFHSLFGEMDTIQKKSNTFQAMVEDTTSLYTMRNNQYILWSLIALIASYVTYRHLRR